MNNKVIGGLLVVLLAGVLYLGWQNYSLNKKVEALTTTPAAEVKPAGEMPEKVEANPSEASPFDKPHEDPMADRLAEKPAVSETTTIKFEKTNHDFGRINEGDVVNTFFKFTNTGKAPLLISKAEGSCGCTVPLWPKGLIQPGESGRIEIEFKSRDKSGQVDKTVLVTSNTQPATTTLVVRSVVIPKDR